MKLWNYSEVCLNKLMHFCLGQFILGDPGYIMNDDNVKVPAGKKACGKCPIKAHVADVHRRHRFVVEYSIGCAKKHFPTAGCPGGNSYVKNPEYHGVAWMVACGLTNFMWDTRGSWLRGDKYFAGQWENWEPGYMQKKFEKELFYRNPSNIDPREGVCFGRELLS